MYCTSLYWLVDLCYAGLSAYCLCLCDWCGSCSPCLLAFVCDFCFTFCVFAGRERWEMEGLLYVCVHLFSFFVFTSMPACLFTIHLCKCVHLCFTFLYLFVCSPTRMFSASLTHLHLISVSCLQVSHLRFHWLVSVTCWFSSADGAGRAI